MVVVQELQVAMVVEQPRVVVEVALHMLYLEHLHTMVAVVVVQVRQLIIQEPQEVVVRAVVVQVMQLLVVRGIVVPQILEEEVVVVPVVHVILVDQEVLEL